MPPVSTRMSRFAGASCKSILYCSPEQPPPTTATRSTPCGRFCRCKSELTFCAALGLTLISRSSPTRKLGVVVVLLAAEAAIIVSGSYRLRRGASTGDEDRARLARTGRRPADQIEHETNPRVGESRA